VVEIPGNVFTFTTDAETETYAAAFVITARIRDEAGRVVDRLSQGYELSGPIERMRAVRSGPVLFYRETELPPGRYTVEAIAYDAKAETATVRRSSLGVPEPLTSRLRLSSVVQVKRVEQVPEEERDPTNPLSFGEILVYPGLGEPVSKSDGQELAFFFTVYSAKRSDAPAATLEVLRDGVTLAQAPMGLPEPDSTGRIQHVLGLPLPQFSPGSYELRVTVKDKRGGDKQSVAFTIEN